MCDVMLNSHISKLLKLSEHDDLFSHVCEYMNDDDVWTKTTSFYGSDDDYDGKYNFYI